MPLNDAATEDRRAWGPPRRKNGCPCSRVRVSSFLGAETATREGVYLGTGRLGRRGETYDAATQGAAASR